MKRAFPYVLAAAAGAVVFQLATASAQVDRRPLRGSEEGLRLVEGVSDRGSFQDALEDATSRAVRGLPGADRMVRYRVREITGESGGIRGANTLRVTIEVPGEGSRALEPLPDRDPRPDRGEGDLGQEEQMDLIRRSIRTEVRVPRQVDRGEAVAIDFVLTNSGDEAVRIPLNSGQKYEFEIHRDNRVVWRWSQGRFFTQQLGSTVIQPNEEVTYRVTWDQRNNDGVRVPAGTYQARAFIPTRWENFRVGDSAPFTIR